MMPTFSTEHRSPFNARRPQATWARRLDVLILSILVMLFALLTPARAAETLPPSPPQYFNDNAHVVSPQVADQLNDELKDFERATSNQVVVAIYPKMQSDSDIFDYTYRTAQSWRVGQKAKRNGVVLFAFIQDRKLFIQVGKGLEGPLPDATCKNIIDTQITPRFKKGDYDGGFIAGVGSIMAATKGEYKGTGHLQGDGDQKSGSVGATIFWVIFFIFVIVIVISSKNSSSSGWGGFLLGSLLGSGGSGGSTFGGGGGFSGGGGGGFSGGGGSFGGGGAGGSW